MQQRNHGITLIALVITIIVLLILAGISIALLTGENGILTRASDSKIQNERVQAKESINLALNAIKTEVLANKSTNSTYDPTKTNERAELMSDTITGLDTTPGSKYRTSYYNSIITITYENDASNINISGSIDLSNPSNGGTIHSASDGDSGNTGGGNTPTPGIYDAETGELLIPWPELVEEIGSGDSGTAYSLSSGLGVGVNGTEITKVWDTSRGLPTGYGR